MRSIEEMQDLEDSESNEEVRGKDAGDVHPANLEYFLPSHLNRKETQW